MCGRTRSCDRPRMPTVATTPDAGPHELGAYRSERPSGEDHRDRHPGYDLDEQAVYADWLRRRDAGPAPGAGRDGDGHGG